MPIFTKKFSKKSPSKPRNRLNSVPKIAEDIDDFKNISIKLDDEKVLKFVDGFWISSKKSSLADDDGILKLVQHNKKLEEEKTMLNAKLEICLDLLTETVAEKEAIEKNIMKNKNSF